MTTGRMCKIMARLSLIVTLVFFQPAVSTLALAPSKAIIRRTVTTEQGALAPKANLTPTNTGTNITRETTSSGDGLYRCPELAPGQYEVRVEVQGFAPEVRGGIDLTVGREAVIDFTLKVGGLQEQVTIQDAPLVETTTSSIAY